MPQGNDTSRHRAERVAPSLDLVAGLLAIVITCVIGVDIWRANLAGAAATIAERHGIVESLRYQGAAEQAEMQARAEEQAYIARDDALLRRDAADDMTSEGALAESANALLAERLEILFPAEFVQDGRFDTGERTDELLEESRVRDRSRETFRAAEEHKRRRRALLGAEVVLVVGFAVVTVTRLGRRRWDAVGAGAALVCLGYALAILAADGF